MNGLEFSTHEVWSNILINDFIVKHENLNVTSNSDIQLMCYEKRVL